jgi:hypothetical protein
MAANKLFENNAITMNAVQTARSTIEIGLNDSGKKVVSVAFCGGKGTSKQEIPAEEFSQVIEALAHYSENGITRSQRSLSAVDQLHSTIAYDDEGMITFRLGTGKGMKPTKIHPDQLNDVVSFLRNECLPLVSK